MATINTPRETVIARPGNQTKYVEQIQRSTIVFGTGPAGTGKTYLAVAMAAMALDKKEVKRLILVRPAVEAGESLGFLPGSLEDKVDPYLRPIFDALHDFIGYEKTEKLIEKGVIEVAPLAFMRGRTLKDAFIILDEAQNTTKTQMKMLLTRIGEGSKLVVNGDTAQIDLKDKSVSGLAHAVELLDGIEGISTLEFEAKDVVRHPLVRKIVEAYDDDMDLSVFASLEKITREYEQSLL
jgi:phosphate starvation-inducible PhoH-like protein